MGKIKKRAFCIILALTLAGCSAGEPAIPEQDVPVPEISEETQIDIPETTGSDAPTEEPTEIPTDAPTEESTEAPTEEPTEEPTEDPLEAEILQKLETLTTEEKVAQLFFVTPEALTGITGAATVAGETTREAFSRCPVGGVLYMEQNLESPEQTRKMLTDMQQISRDRLGLPVFLAVDEEGGTVARLSNRAQFGVGPYPDMASLDGDEARAGEIGNELGWCLFELGFNLDFAPVADVWTNPQNTVVRRRAFSSDPETVTKMCAAFSDGLQAAGILSCYKHFPGHGATAEDSHLGYALSERTLEELERCELLPYFDAARRQVPFVMVGHISLPNVTEEEVPASLSKELVTGLLREQIGYQGLIITDALNMGAISGHYSMGEACVLAILAGDDLLLLADHLPEAYEAVLKAVQDGTIPMQRLNESVLRILRCKHTIE